MDRSRAIDLAAHLECRLSQFSMNAFDLEDGGDAEGARLLRAALEPMRRAARYLRERTETHVP